MHAWGLREVRSFVEANANLKAVEGALQGWSRGKYVSILKKIERLKMEARRMQEDGIGGLD